MKIEDSIDILKSIEQTKYVNFGVVIENGSDSFSKTKVIKIVPRYIIYNTLEDPIAIKQKYQETQIIIQSGSKIIYNF